MRLRPFLLLLLPPTVACAGTGFEQALALVHAKRYPEARDALQQVVRAEPRNAAAWCELGRVWEARHDAAALRQAADCLDRAVALQPLNASYLTRDGIVLIRLAARTHSLSAAVQGRDTLEKAVAIAPSNLDAREALYHFYARAPFFVGGSSAKAAAELDAIRRHDPDRAAAIEILGRIRAGRYADAFRLCDGILARAPNDYTALWLYGRTASLSGENTVRALACLHRAAMLPPPHRNSPDHAAVWMHIGELEEKRSHTAAARAAFREVQHLAPGNPEATAGLQRLGRTQAPRPAIGSGNRNR